MVAGQRDRSLTVATGLVAVAVAIAFADSSVVVLALPELYGRFHTTIEGVSWVVTAYNVAVASSRSRSSSSFIAPAQRGC